MSTGSNPVFPTMIYNFSISYLINLININKMHKNLYFEIIYTKKIYNFLNFLKKHNVIYKYILIKNDNKTKIKIYLYYYKNKTIFNNFKLISKPSHKINTSLHSLRLLDKKSGSSVFIISTSKGFITHKEALKNQISGYLVGFFSI